MAPNRYGYLEDVYSKKMYLMNNTYFTDTGDYGEANNLFVLDTSQWNHQDWEQIYLAHFARRQQVALRIAKSYQQKEE
jgi:hypothetical protein